MNANSPTIIRGTSGDDILKGTLGIDRIFGFGGNDVLQGRKGSDRLLGGAGDDTLLGNEKNDRLWGNAGDDILSGGTGRDRLWGGTGDDLLSGGAGSDRLWGNAGTDHLLGDAGNDQLVGGGGNDYLLGGTGADTFSFLSPNHGIDTIIDFNLAQGDRIQVSANGFGGGLTVGILDTDEFTIGSAATNASDRFIYNDTTGALFFDADGTGAQTQTQFAQLSTGLALTNSDIFVV
ncbi:MAG: calcium-binding protein [Symploca sp. SIO2D2]|nr:calcium-binding protein [Symploca sp. SIO2D2]